MTNRMLATVLVLALLAVMLVGCQTPTQEWAAQREALTQVEHAVADLHTAEVIDDENLRDVYPWLEVARGALVRAEAKLPEGGDKFDNLLETARDVLRKADMYLLHVNNGGDE